MSENDQPTVTLLFVDDSVTDRTRGVGLVRKHHPDWHVIPADDGNEALQILDNGNVDIVVSDLVMPGIDGRELLRMIVADYPMTPVVLITAQGDDQIAAECMKLGAINYVPKRALAAELVSVLDVIVRSEQEAAELRRVFRHVSRNQCEFEIDNDIDEIRALLNFVQNRLGAYNVLSPQKVRDLTTAVRECLLNAYYHGNLEVASDAGVLSRAECAARATERQQAGEFQDRRIRFRMSLNPETVSLGIRDDGSGFDHSGVSLSLRATADASESSQGQGFQTIQQFVDEFSFNEKGNEITLTVKRKREF